MTNIYKVLLTGWRRKPASTDMERNYATVTLCIARKTHNAQHKLTEKMHMLIRKSTCESRQTAAGKSIHVILTCSVLMTRITSTFIDVSLATNACEE